MSVISYKSCFEEVTPEIAPIWRSGDAGDGEIYSPGIVNSSDQAPH